MIKFLFIIGFVFSSFSALSQSRVEAENFSAMSGVTTENGWGDGGCINVAPIDQGDWMDYTINPTSTGIYTIIFRIGTVNTGAQLQVKKSDGTVLATANLPNAGDYQSFQSVPVTVNLIAGQQTIRIQSSAATQWTFNWFEYSAGYKMEAELYSAMFGVATEGSTDVGGGQDVGYIDTGDWMDYSVNLQSAGTYTATFRVAAQNAVGQQLSVKNSAGTILASVNIPTTGGWQSWQTAQANITLPAGQQTLRIYATVGGWNFNWWVLTPPNSSPSANAGGDATIYLPSNSVTLNGSGSDPDGSIASYLWNQVSGPANSTISPNNTASTTVSGLVEGTYVFRLTVTDNNGATATDEVTVSVNASAGGSNGWLTSGNSGTDASTQFIGTTDLQPLIFKTNNQQQAKITSTGEFWARKIKVTQDGWADYVFDSTYTLRPLCEVEQFIESHKHLPDVPTEKEVREQGLNIGENQAILLKKIEELTLYIIEMNKRLEKVSKENAELKTKLSKKQN